MTAWGEAERSLGLLHDVKKRDQLSVYTWCIMPNHYHLAARTVSVPLWKSIRHLQHRHTQELNRRCRVLGPFVRARTEASRNRT